MLDSRPIAKKCSVYGCGKPSIAKGLCDAHRKRVERHGDVFDRRPVDWGLKDRHPLYQSYRGFYRATNGLCEEWRADFREFAKAVGDRPSPKHTLVRMDDRQPIGPGNWYWRESTTSPQEKSDHAAYMREYSRARRAADPFHELKISLQRRYGITLERYLEMHESQNGRCAVCGKHETAVDRRTKLARRLAVDHDHETGAVRALLCHACNTGIGAFKEDLKALQSAIAYLERHCTSERDFMVAPVPDVPHWSALLH